jgi:hypothetical protein
MFLILQNNDFMIPSGKNILLFFILLFIFKTGNSQDLFNVENSKKFANYLLNTRQYNLAALEYERILSISKPDAEISSNLLKTYRLGNICEQSFPNFKALEIEKFLGSKIVAKEFLNLALTCNCCYLENDFNLALSSLDTNSQAFYKLGYYLFKEEKELLFSFKEENKNLLENSYPSVFNAVEKMDNFNRKSPGLAMAMSAVLPGSGKAYSGLWGDAVMSLMFVSTNAWLAYRGFNKKGVESASGWIFGSVSLGFYMGNIWGSGKAAKTYNEVEYEKMYHDAKNSIYSHF